jgi:tRNA (uracil-5-)-methyltransferase TRM9
MNWKLLILLPKLLAKSIIVEILKFLHFFAAQKNCYYFIYQTVVILYFILITYQYSMASNTRHAHTESSDTGEASYIGSVYNSISADFSRTRYKVWPCVARFLDQIINGTTTPSCLVGETTPSCLVGEIGCGNGKNLAYLSGTNGRIRTLGIDISDELLEICKARGIEVMLGSILNIPLDDHALDYTLSIAVIHHLRDRADRIHALRELARVTRLGGRCLITVWARVQNEGDGKRRFATNDEMVPFKTKTGETHYRFYHLYDDCELADDLAQVPEFRVANLFIERGNYIAELVRV